MDEIKSDADQGSSAPEVTKAEVKNVEAKLQADPVKETPAASSLNPADAAREAIFQVIRDPEMSADEKVSAAAPLIKTLIANQSPSNPSATEIPLAPQGYRRWSMLNGPVPKPVSTGKDGTQAS